MQQLQGLKKLRPALDKEGNVAAQTLSFFGMLTSGNIVSYMHSQKLSQTCGKLSIFTGLLQHVTTNLSRSSSRNKSVKISLLQLAFADLLQLEPTCRKPVGNKF